MLLYGPSVALNYWARRDLLEEAVGPPETLWETRDVARLLRRQQANGSWQYPGGGLMHHRAFEDYDQLDTFRLLGYLIEEWGLDSRHPAIAKAAEYMLSRQTDEGDLRGIYGTQYTPNYTAAIMELLIKAGYGEDARIAKGFAWLLSMRQDDGGWAIPLRTRGAPLDVSSLSNPTVQPDRSMPFSHMATGVVLRAFAVHPQYRNLPEAHAAAELLASRLFQRDAYPDRGSPDFWLSCSFPFWFTDIVSALDSLSRLGFGHRDRRIQSALERLAALQQENGMWQLHYLKKGSDGLTPLWVGLAICRVFQRVC